MYNLDRYEFSAEDNLYEKIDAKIGNALIRSEEYAELKHQTSMQKQEAKYWKAKAKAEAAKKNYYAKCCSSVEFSDDNTKNRVINL